MNDEAELLGCAPSHPVLVGALMFGALATFVYLVQHCAELEAENGRLRAASTREALMTLPPHRILQVNNVQAVKSHPGPVAQYSLFTVN